MHFFFSLTFVKKNPSSLFELVKGGAISNQGRHVSFLSMVSPTMIALTRTRAHGQRCRGWQAVASFSCRASNNHSDPMLLIPRDTWTYLLFYHTANAKSTARAYPNFQILDDETPA